MERLSVLFEKYLANQLTEDEFREFWQLLDEEGRLTQLSPQLQTLWEQQPAYTLPDEEWDAKMKLLRRQAVNPKKKISLWRYAAAACLLLALGSYWFFTGQQQAAVNIAGVHQAKAEAIPGHSGAVLTLSNGRKITLDEAGNGRLAQDADVNIIKKDGEVVYAGNASETVYNSISTDKGRQWQLKLPDGTKVWLNSVSSIRYPISFTGKERLVEISGEAYFEVVHNDVQPFRIKVGNRIIEDVGTSFNVNAYEDEPVLKTTMVEGVVKMYAAGQPGAFVTLTKGQQLAIRPTGETRIQDDADVEEVLSWKNGLFSFNHTSLENIMRQISRWYDLDVVYHGKVGKETFSGMVSRNSNLSQVLKIMEQASIGFRMEGKKLIVTP